MNIKILITSALFLLQPQAYSVPYASEDFKHDSVIPPLTLGEYKVLNGCPAILKKKLKMRRIVQ